MITFKINTLNRTQIECSFSNKIHKNKQEKLKSVQREQLKALKSAFLEGQRRHLEFVA